MTQHSVLKEQCPQFFMRQIRNHKSLTIEEDEDGEFHFVLRA